MNHEKLLGCLPIGTENRVSRAQLQKWLHMPDRAIRDAIKAIRMQQIPIVSSSSQPGYSIASTQADIDAFIRENQSRIRELEAINETMRKCRAVPDSGALWQRWEDSP